MAKTSMKVKQQRKQKFSTRAGKSKKEEIYYVNERSNCRYAYKNS